MILGEYKDFKFEVVIKKNGNVNDQGSVVFIILGQLIIKWVFF